jgi:hypothetical protein
MEEVHVYMGEICARYGSRQRKEGYGRRLGLRGGGGLDGRVKWGGRGDMYWERRMKGLY